MSGYLDQFNQLKPQERRILMIAVLAVFVVFNYIWIWPHFGEWGTSQAAMDKALAEISRDRREIAMKDTYQRRVNELQKDGMLVEPEEQAIHLARKLQELATDNGVLVESLGRPVVRTNDPFFLEQEVGLNAQCTETNMVNFLYSLGSGNSMMRVRGVNLRPDQSRMQLSANMTVVASYQRKQPGRIPGAASPASPAAPAGVKLPAIPPVAKPVVSNIPIPPRKPAATNKAGILTVNRP
jgi:hypothetical protein